MTSTEIAIHENGNGQVAERDVVDGWLTMASDVIKLANVIAPTEFVPYEIRDNPPAVAAAILTGRELGIGPMTALRHVQMVKGTPTLSAEYKRARVLAAGHEFDVLELNTTRCRVSGRRRGSNKPPLEITFTMDDAKTAGLLTPSRSGKPGAWQTRPRRMLFARAGSELCDFLFADVVNGLPTAEVFDDGIETAELAEQENLAAPEPDAAARVRTTQRKTRRQVADNTSAAPSATASEGATRDRQPPAPAATAPSDQHSMPSGGLTGGQPPLPGEEDNTPPPGPDAASAAQIGIIVRHFTRLGFGEEDREQRLQLTARLAGRLDSIGSTKELSRDQALAVADTLARCKNRERLITLLAEGDKPDA